MAISNKQFWVHWDKGEYEEALKCSLDEKGESKNRLQNMLFGTPEQIKQTGVITTISVGEFIYDYMMINPTVVKGIDFARKDDFSSLFTLSQFSSKIDVNDLTGNIAQLQGYVAEQMLATELRVKGHDVEFPEESNNPGWDLLVDGQQFQVKNLANPSGVREHLEKYPDIPVYVNEELAPYFEGNPAVYVSSISREEVLEATTTTIKHAGELLDFEIPWITLGVSSIYNIKRIWKDDVSMNQAIFNVVSDTSSRVALGALGQKAGIVVGAMLFGPAGGITGAMFGVYAGASQGGKLSTNIKRIFAKKQEKELNQALVSLLEKVIIQIDEKLKIKNHKMNDIRSNLDISKANIFIKNETERRYKEENDYLKNKKEELSAAVISIQKGAKFPLDIIPGTMAAITRTGVHPIHFQDEMKLVQEESREYVKRM
ncbi:hypothetical protein [Bacillus paramycoides]|uniref:hypothetical protein n=1 Tax=Bacillus paramycoides TaxID=2026194 RepID=UPI003822D059